MSNDPLDNQFFRLTKKRLAPDETRIRDGLQAIGEAWAEEVRLRVPPSLRKKIRWQQSSGRQGKLIIPLILWYREKGTTDHIIRPRTKRALSFAWGGSNAPHTKDGTEGAANYVFSSVHHPGQEAKPFLDDAWESERVQRAIEELGQHVYRIER